MSALPQPARTQWLQILVGRKASFHFISSSQQPCKIGIIIPIVHIEDTGAQNTGLRSQLRSLGSTNLPWAQEERGKEGLQARNKTTTFHSLKLPLGRN